MKNMDEFRADVYARAEKLKNERKAKMLQIKRFSSMAAMLVIVVASVFAVKSLAPTIDRSTDIDPYNLTETTSSKEVKSGDITQYSITTTRPVFPTTTPMFPVTTSLTTTKTSYATTTTTPPYIQSDGSTTGGVSVAGYTNDILDLQAEYTNNDCLIIKSSAKLDEWITLNVGTSDIDLAQSITEKYDDAYFNSHHLAVCLISAGSDELMGSAERFISLNKGNEREIIISVSYSAERRTDIPGAYLALIEISDEYDSIRMYLAD